MSAVSLASPDPISPPSRIGWIAGGTVLLVAIGIGVYFAFFRKGSSLTKARTTSSTPTPTTAAVTLQSLQTTLNTLQNQFELVPKMQSVSAVLNESTDVGKQYYLYISGLSESTWRLSGTLLVEGFGFGDVADSGARMSVLNAFYNSATSSAVRVGALTGASYGSAAIQSGNLDIGSGSGVISSQEFRIGVKRLNALYGPYNLRLTCILPLATPFTLRFGV